MINVPSNRNDTTLGTLSARAPNQDLSSLALHLAKHERECSIEHAARRRREKSLPIDEGHAERDLMGAMQLGLERDCQGRKVLNMWEDVEFRDPRSRKENQHFVQRSASNMNYRDWIFRGKIAEHERFRLSSMSLWLSIELRVIFSNSSTDIISNPSQVTKLPRADAYTCEIYARRSHYHVRVLFCNY